MRKCRVRGIETVLDVLEVIAVPNIGAHFKHAWLLEIRVARQGWGIAVTEVGEDEAEVLLGGVAADAHLGREGGVLGRHLHALAGGVVLPAVVEAADAVALHPAGAELGAAVGAAEGEEVGSAALAAIEGEVFAHDADGHGAAGRQLLRHIDRMPEPAEVASHQSAGPRVDEVTVVCCRVAPGRLARSRHSLLAERCASYHPMECWPYIAPRGPRVKTLPVRGATTALWKRRSLHNAWEPSERSEGTRPRRLTGTAGQYTPPRRAPARSGVDQRLGLQAACARLALGHELDECLELRHRRVRGPREVPLAERGVAALQRLFIGSAGVLADHLLGERLV